MKKGKNIKNSSLPVETKKLEEQMARKARNFVLRLSRNQQKGERKRSE